ncbi:Gag-Pol polyprotein [Plakobranchus ocellatus]|uniref:Gag-Pol polyprotein n=1 Tax=Plakobranchus ocellatus TaxID=259542 RepID=A0AAV3YZA9_9GAST|nr:Gag-Pol polyprotein [Plakobranchus ocellatus]
MSNTEYDISLPLLVLLYLTALNHLRLRKLSSPKNNPLRWKRPALQVNRAAYELHHCTWYLKQMEVVSLRRLPLFNDKAIPDRYLIPQVHSFTIRLARETTFSKTDLVRGYHQIPVLMDDVTKSL